MTVALLAERLRLLPDTLRETLSVALPEPPRASRWLTTGIGMSEAPARLLACLLRRRGVLADFAPLSSLQPSASDSALVVFSQGLSPNASIALSRASMHPHALLVTSLETVGAPGLSLVRHPPADESGLLLRTLGPAAASLIACRLAHAITGDPSLSPEALAEIPNAVARAHTDAALGAAPVALITSGIACEYALLARWSLLEALLVHDPPVWDALQFAHGPFQCVHPRAFTLVALESSADPAGRALIDRLAPLLSPERHRLVRLTASLPQPLCLFEQHSLLTRMCLDHLERHPRDLAHWPGQGLDSPLYDLTSLP